MAAIPDIVLERYRLGELPDADADRVRRLVADDPMLSARVLALSRSDQEIHETHPPERLAQVVRARIDAGRRRTRPVNWPLAGKRLAAVAGIVVPIVLMMVWWPATRPIADPVVAPAPDGGGGERIKGGGLALSVYRSTKDGPERLADGDVAREGDLIRIGYTAAGQPFGVIVSLDDRGAVTTHLPSSGAQAARLKGDPGVLLDEAYELDDAPRWERFYFVTGQRAFDVQSIVDAVRQAGGAGAPSPPAALPLPTELEQTAFLLQKEARR